ncbi:MAG: hypothetical protein IPH40_03910 [Polaromonas sp.]|nr:hypothetical protein [Polaromonas sp.]
MNTQRRIYLKNAMATALAASPLVNTIAHAISRRARKHRLCPSWACIQIASITCWMAVCLTLQS